MCVNDLEKVLVVLGFSDFVLKSVSGGDINEAYLIQKGQTRYFLKVNDAFKFPDMFKQEANALQFLKENTSFKIPHVKCVHASDKIQLLIMEWIEQEEANNRFWISAGENLAKMHLVSHTVYGWHEDNYIGTLSQNNSFASSWHEFYAKNRLLPLTQQLERIGLFSESDSNNMERLCEQLPNVLPQEQPALLHGDLWSGNVMSSVGSVPCIFDPALYFGHREMDIAMTLLFGGFPKIFYEAYESVHPLQAGWQKRMELSQLYPLLVHAVLFGGHYAASVKSIMKRYS
jgi:fructosamine-3-kinase